MTKLRDIALAVATTLAAAAGASYGAEPAPSPTRNLSGLVGVDFKTDYISRGLVLENQGFIAQPYGELAFKLMENKEGLQKVSLYGGIWNSLHSEHTDEEGDRPGEDSSTDAWYEFDWYVGLSVNFADKWTAQLSYWEFISPNDGFGTSHNVELRLKYNDTGMFAKDFALNPYGVIFVELDGKAGTGTDEGVYFELGIAPALPAFGGPDYPITVAFPIAVGLGASNFYGEEDDRSDNEFFGYVSVSAVASMPLKFMADAGFGNWSWNIGGSVYFFGDGLASFNEGNVKGDDELEWVAFTGVSFSW
jgi:hypothetical protein